MIFLCPVCNFYFNDRFQRQTCPHSPHDRGESDLCQPCGILQSINGPCSHRVAVVSATEESSNA